MRRAVLGAMGMVMATVGAVPLHAACWTAEDVSAAKVRDLQTGLMIASSLCQAAGLDGASDYESFSVSGRRALAAANQRLKSRFILLYGEVQGPGRYDAFLRSLQQGYVGQSVESDSCTGMSAISREAAAVGTSLSALVQIADRIGVVPSLPEGACSMVYAARDTGAAPPR